MPMPMYNSALP